MQANEIPTKLTVPFADEATASFRRAIPLASQIGINDGFASLQTGFPPLNFTPVSAGGVPPFGQDMNGILYEISAWTRWVTAGGAPVKYDGTFSAAVGGYPLGAIVMSANTPGVLWISTADDNVTNPDAGGAGWSLFSNNGSRIVTSSATLTLTAFDHAVGLNRTTAVAAMTVNLCQTPFKDMVQRIEDLAGNFDTANVLVVPPAGMSIAGAPNFTLGERRMSGAFRYYGSDIWSKSVS